ncbi:MAG: hypothetical protein O7E52_05775 [Candidatus Poribacteria bacterium]|nr:hypothetical protein [Candidatus Poribacteria bacterium]
MIIIYLFLATLAVFIGAAIAFVSQDNTNLFSTIFGFAAGAVFGILLRLVLHLYSEYGVYPLFVMAGGFLLIFLIERLSHQPSHPLLSNHLWVADLTLIGLSIHALTDGLNLVVASKDETLGTGLAMAIIAHRLPIAIALTLTFLQKNSLLVTLGRLSPLAVAPLVGALIGERVVTGAFGEFTEYLTAFAGGTLLHVLIHDFKGSYAPNRAEKLVGGVAFAVGLVAAVFLMSQNSHFWHAH